MFILVSDIDGQYGEWSEWSTCSVSLSCERGGVRTRTRACDSPSPQGNGQPCDGDSLEAEGCDGEGEGSCMFETMPSWKPDVSVTKVNGQGNPQALLLGEWMQYHMCLDLPTMKDDKNIWFEMWTNNPTNGLQSSPEPGRTSLSLTDVHIDSYGGNLETWYEGNYTNSSDVAPVETMWYHDTGGDQMERKQYKITGLTNFGEDGVNNRITMDYSIIFSNILNNVIKSNTYYISSGVIINDYYNEVRKLFKGYFIFLLFVLIAA